MQAMLQIRVLLLGPRVSTRSALVKLACRNKLCSQKGNPADRLNVLNWSHASPVIIHLCRGDNIKLHLFRMKGKKTPVCLLFDFLLFKIRLFSCSDIFSFLSLLGSLSLQHLQVKMLLKFSVVDQRHI